MVQNDKILTPQILVRSKNGVELFPVPSPNSNESRDIVVKGGKTLIQNESCTFHAFSSDGSKVLLLRPSVGLVLLNQLQPGSAGSSPEPATEGLNSVLEQDSKLVHLAYFSPLGNYIITWERPIKTKDGSSPPNNLKLWNGHDGKLLTSFFCKAMPQKLPSPNPTCIGGEQYSALQFTYDERLLCHLVSNEIHVYDTNDIASSSASASSSCPITFKVRRPNLSSFTLAPKNMTSTSTNATEYLLSTFIPEVKGKPAQVALHKLSVEQPNESSSSSNNNNNNNNNKSMKESILTSKSFFQTESVTVKWSPLGNSALILAQTTVDATGESYYGSSMLHLLLSHPKPDNIQVQLPGKGNGVVHDVAWCPVPSVQYTATAAAAPNDTNNINIPTPCFALISGKMPAMGSLHYGTTGDASFLFGEAHRNVVSWSPHGRFLCLAGFGNLAGGMDFWDRNKLKKMPRFHPGQSNPLQDEIRAPCAVGYGWSPDSRTFFVSTTSPRMNVDNSIALFKYNGYGPFDQHQLAVAWDNQSYLPNKLHSVEFVPTPAYTYSDRSQSPPPKKRKDGQDMDPSISNAILPSTSSSNRSKNSTTSSASKPTPSVGRYIPPSARGKAGTGTGGNSLAERMRREREGSTAQAGKVTKGGVSSSSSTVSTFGTTNAPPTKSKNAIRREKQRLAKLKAKEEEEKAVAAAAQEAAKAKEAASIVTVDPEKRAKKIKKLLKQIDDLKLKNPGDLNDDQRKKLLNEDDLRKELANLAI